MEYVAKNDYIVSVDTNNNTEVATLLTVFTIFIISILWFWMESNKS